MKYIKSALAVVVAIAAFMVSGLTTEATNRSNSGCLDPKDTHSFVTSLTRGSGTISTRGGKPLCGDAELVLQSFKMPNTWDGKGWNRTAIPQTKHAAIPFTFPAGKANFKKTIEISVPDVCFHTQLDFYFTPVVEAIIGYHDGEDREIYGQIFKATGTCKTPEKPVKKISVCDLSIKAIVEINKSDYDSVKYSKDHDDCQEKPVRYIEVCQLDTKKVVTIKKNEFDKTQYSKDRDDCKEEEVPVVTPTEPEKPVTPETPVVEETPAELPETGAASIAGSILGLGSLVAASYYYAASRKLTA